MFYDSVSFPDIRTLKDAQERPCASSSLASLRAFEAVARTGSVTRAAEELARSRHLSLLADDVGAELFERDGTGLRMTPAAADFYAVTRSVFDQLERAYDNLGSRAAGPGVHVACSATFAMRWLVPQLAVFYRKHAGYPHPASMTSAREIRNEGADVLVAWDMSSYSDADQRRALPLAPVNFAAVCVPACARLAAAKRTRIAHGYTSSAWGSMGGQDREIGCAWRCAGVSAHPSMH